MIPVSEIDKQAPHINGNKQEEISPVESPLKSPELLAKEPSYLEATTKQKKTWFPISRLTYRLIRGNLSAFLIFQLLIIYSTLLLSIVRSVFIEYINKTSGIQILVQDNVKKIFQEPKSLALLFILLIIELFFLFWGITANYRICAAGLRGERLRTFSLFKDCSKTFISLWHPKRFLIIPLTVLPLLLSYVNLYAVTTENFRLPEFVIDGIAEKASLHIAFIILRILMTLFWGYMVFVGAGIFLEKKKFVEAVRNSHQLIRRHWFKYLLLLVFILVVIPFLISFLYFLILGVAYLCNRNNDVSFSDALYQANWRASIYLPMVTNILQTTVLVATYAVLRKMPMPEIPRRKRVTKHRAMRLGLRVVSFVLLVILIELFYIYQNPNHAKNNRIERPILIAHRAGGTLAPENSLEALKTTIDSKRAAMVEIDVQLTLDHAIILHHDKTLKRLTGKTQKVSELSLKEIKTLPTRGIDGKWQNIPLVTLQEFIDASEDLELMIELKAEKTLMEPLIDQVIKVVRDNQIEKRSIIASMDRQVLRLAKEKAPDIRTVLISAILLGGDIQIPYIDAYSLEATGVNRSLVESVHDANKKIYSWTINTQRGIKRILRAWPDGIVTDNVYFADYAMHTFDDNILMQNDIMMYYLEKDKSLVEAEYDDEFTRP